MWKYLKKFWKVNFVQKMFYEHMENIIYVTKNCIGFKKLFAPKQTVLLIPFFMKLLMLLHVELLCRGSCPGHETPCCQPTSVWCIMAVTATASKLRVSVHATSSLPWPDSGHRAEEASSHRGAQELVQCSFLSFLLISLTACVSWNLEQRSEFLEKVQLEYNDGFL